MIGAVMEHVEEAGIHSGDSACIIPPPSLSPAIVTQLEEYALKIANELEVIGLINVQFAVKGDDVYVIEANPRASRTVPFVAKATGVPLAKIAARVMMGASLEELRSEGLVRDPVTGHVAIKEAVLPFSRLNNADPVLGPEMRSTGEVMGIDSTTGRAFTKSQMAAGDTLPESGTVFFSLADRDKAVGVEAATGFIELGFDLVATDGTADAFEAAGLTVSQRVGKLSGPDAVTPGERITAVDLINDDKIDLVVNSPKGRAPRSDGADIRAAAAGKHIPLLTTGAAALASARGLSEWMESPLTVKSLQEYHGT